MNPLGAQTPIYLDQHALLVGTTGSGKSTRMVRQLAWRMGRVKKIDPSAYKILIVDTKPVSFGQDDDVGHYGFTGGAIYRDWRVLDLAKAPGRLLIYRPTQDLINPDEFAKFFNRLLDYRYHDNRTKKDTPLPFTIIVDELVDIFSSEKTRTAYIEGFTKILVQGRSSLQTLWILTQYPTYIDPSIKRNVAVNFVFRLPDENDRKVMAGILGFKEVGGPIRSPHGFFYQNAAIAATTENLVYYNGNGPAPAMGRAANA